MTKKDFFIVIVKLFGLNAFLVTLFSVIPASIPFLGLDSNSSDILLTISWLLVMIFIFGGLLILLLFYSHKVVTFLKLDKGFDDDFIQFGNLSEEKILCLGLILVGAYIFIENLPVLVVNLYYAFKASAQNNMDSQATEYGSMQDYIKLGARFFSVLLGYLIVTNYNWIGKKILSKNNQ